MLLSLHMENVAVVQSADLTLGGGLTVLTGETGAGKSVILGAQQLLLGAKVRRELVRTGESKALVSGIFGHFNPETLSALGELGIHPDEEGLLYLQRTISADGHAVSRLSGRQIPAQLQREIGSILLSVHGQHENQRLLNPAEHLRYLDKFAGDDEALQNYHALYTQLTALRSRLAQSTQDVMERQRLIEMYRFQLEDIDAAKLRVGEEEALEQRRLKLRSADKIAKQAHIILRALTGGDKGMGACDLIAHSAGAFAQLENVVPDAVETAERLRSLQYELEAIAETASGLLEEQDENPEALLDRIESRLEVISRLRRKYGENISEILAYREKTAAALSSLEHADEQTEALQKEIARQTALVQAAGSILTELRQKAARNLSQAVTAELRDLEMPRGRFEVALQPGDPGESGCESAEFFFSANMGEPPRPLSKIASGGELSRVMLALKHVLADREATETLIFDEIDTGVSGKTAESIGEKLWQIGQNCQVLCITHAAQIAALADCHLFVEKAEQNGRTVSHVRPLDNTERIKEIARIMGGAVITETLYATAQEMRQRACQLCSAPLPSESSAVPQQNRIE